MCMRNLFGGANCCSWFLFVIILLLLCDNDDYGCARNNDCGCGC